MACATPQKNFNTIMKRAARGMTEETSCEFFLTTGKVSKREMVIIHRYSEIGIYEQIKRGDKKRGRRTSRPQGPLCESFRTGPLCASGPGPSCGVPTAETK